MKLSEQIAYKPIENVNQMDLINWAREAIQLEDEIRQLKALVTQADTYIEAWAPQDAEQAWRDCLEALGGE